MGVEARRLGPGVVAWQRDRPPGTSVQHGRVAAALSSTSPIHASRLSPLVDDELGARRLLDVLGPRLVVVGVGVGLEDLVDVDGVAADSAHDVAELRGRDDHVDRAGCAEDESPSRSR